MSLCVPVVSPEFMPHISVDMGVYERVPDPVCLVSVSLSISLSVYASECECVMGLKPTDVLEQASARSSRRHTRHCPLWALNGSQPWAHPSSRGWALTHGYSMGFWEATAGEDGLLWKGHLALLPPPCWLVTGAAHLSQAMGFAAVRSLLTVTVLETAQSQTQEDNPVRMQQYHWSPGYVCPESTRHSQGPLTSWVSSQESKISKNANTHTDTHTSEDSGLSVYTAVI